MADLSLAEARRIALAAQGFADPRPRGRVDARHLRRVLDRTGLLQMDSVNVLARAHYLPVASRIGRYDRDRLDRMAYVDRELFEFWGHEASLIPMAKHPLFRWRMAKAAERWETWGGPARLARERPDYVAGVLAAVTERGPLRASDLEGAGRTGPWWGWHDAKVALEWLFWTGVVTTSSRRGFERVYDLTERVIPASVLALPTPDPADAFAALLLAAGRSCGVATATDLRDYYRLPAAESAAALAGLVAAGALLPVTVEGWRTRAYLHPDAAQPRRVTARALLAPFDPVVWERSRTERLFGFRYRVEIYVPAAKRVHGYYVLPFLLGDRLVARVDLKADRAGGRLLVQSAWAEPNQPAQKDRPGRTAEALAGSLRECADWLGLADVVVRPVGDLSPALAAQPGVTVGTD